MKSALGLFLAGTCVGVLLFCAAGDRAIGIAALIIMALVGLAMGVLLMGSKAKPLASSFNGNPEPCDCARCNAHYDIEPPLTKDECAALRGEIAASTKGPRLVRKGNGDAS